MSKLRSLTVAGFRGILPEVKLDMTQNGKPTSFLLFGRNGDGKSSFVDAWEWFVSPANRIEHLSREGAKESAYPHFKASDTFVEVDFTDGSIGNNKKVFDKSRVTMPATTPEISKVYDLLKTPCHLRYGDLHRFVLLTKSDKYKALAPLMGFEPQLLLQEVLEKATRKLQDAKQGLDTEEGRLKSGLAEVCGNDVLLETTFIDAANDLLVPQGIEKITVIDQLKDVAAELKAQEKETIGKRAALKHKLEMAQQTLEKIVLTATHCQEHKDFLDKLGTFKKNEDLAKKLVFVDFYEHGMAAIEAYENNGCPLCERPFTADDNMTKESLLQAVENRLTSLNELSQERQALETARTALISKFTAEITKCSSFATELENAGLADTEALVNASEDYKKEMKAAAAAIAVAVDQLDPKAINTADSGLCRDFHKAIETTVADITAAIEKLEPSADDKKLAEIVETLEKLSSIYARWRAHHAEAVAHDDVIDAFITIKDDFIKKSKAEVQKRFDRISDKVNDYLKILHSEKRITAGQIKLLEDESKAAELEITYFGQKISPAYKCLSESQLNSLGLCIFLACVQEFNPDFRFMILDDVVNSFDQKHRAHVGEILGDHFSDYQVVIFTHDELWFEMLKRKFPSWVKKTIYRWEYETGPIIDYARTTFEEIEKLLAEGNPKGAGHCLGLHMEGRLIELCENLEAQVKYRRDNKRMLDELFSASQTRVKKKLAGNEALIKLVDSVSTDLFFRNICDHWQDLSSDVSPEEIKGFFEKWVEMESAFLCDKCGKFVRYEKVAGVERVICPCAQLKLL